MRARRLAWLSRPTSRRRPPARFQRTRTTPILVPRRIAYVSIAALALLALLVVYLVPSIVTILLGGSALALVLWYPVGWLSAFMPRGLAILAGFGGALLLFALMLFLLVPPLVSQFTTFVEDLPEIARDLDTGTRDIFERLEEEGFVPQGSDQAIRDLQQELIDRAGGVGERMVEAGVNVLGNALGIVVQGFGILFVAVYLLLDGRRIRVISIWRAPRPYRADMAELWDAIGETLARYLAGIVLVAVLEGLLVGLALWVLEIPYAIALTVWVALTSLIPYVGAWLGAIPVVVLAFLQSPLVGFAMLGWFFTTETAVGNLVTPRVQGGAVRVHPVLVLLGVVAGGSLFGPLGVLLAAPLLGVGRVLFDFIAARARLRD